MTTYKGELLRLIDSQEVVNHTRAGASPGLQGAKATGQMHRAWRAQFHQNVGVLGINRVWGGDRNSGNRCRRSRHVYWGLPESPKLPMATTARLVCQPSVSMRVWLASMQPLCGPRLSLFFLFFSFSLPLITFADHAVLSICLGATFGPFRQKKGHK